MKRSFIFCITFGLLVQLHADVGKLSAIVDGDTVKFGDTICRFAYIDTPESKKNDRAKKKVDSCDGMTIETMIESGKESTSHLSELLEKGKSYKFDIQGEDRYQRKICVIWLNNGTSVNKKMVEDGYAVPYYDYIKDENVIREMKKAYKEAKQNRRGLFVKYESSLKCIE